MPRLYVSGIVGAGKTEAINATKELAKRTCRKEIYNVSLGDIFAEFGCKLGIPRNRLNYLPNNMQNALRTGLMKACSLELLKYSKDDLVIIDGPLTIVDNYGITQETFKMSEFETLKNYPVERPIDRRFVSIIDDSKRIIKRNEGTSYPTDPPNILNWTVQEVEKTNQFSDHYVGKGALAVPKDYSEQLLLKLLLDPDAPVAYFAYPITETRNQPKLRRKIDEFRQKLNLCCAFVNPIELSDLNADTKSEITYTKYRDLNWFIRQAEFVIAYFPGDLTSKGVPQELREGELLARINILIHPDTEFHPFGIKTDCHFKNEDEFFTSVKSARTVKKFKTLAKFLEDDSDMFRYESLFKSL